MCSVMKRNSASEQKRTITVVISSYNYARFVGVTIQSVIDQTRAADEIIVVDDGSVDNSLEVIAGYSGFVHLIAKRNGGQASALNAGFAASRGDIVFFLDSDDRLLPDCLVQRFHGSTPITPPRRFCRSSGGSPGRG